MHNDPANPVYEVPHKLFHVRVVRVGFGYLVIGFIICCMGIFDLAASSVAFDIFYRAKIGAGIWVGFAVVISGGIGVVTSRSELRRRYTLKSFFLLSIICIVLSVVLIIISMTELVSAGYAQGRASVLQTGPCFNTTLNETCLSQTTFSQKYVADGMLTAFGFLEVLFASYGLFVTIDIMDKQNIDMSFQFHSNQPNNDVPLPGISVSEYFNDRLRQQTTENNESTTEMRPSSLHGSSLRHKKSESASFREFPDSEQFRSNYETVDPGSHS